MKATIFARPNLKVFFLGAIAIVLLAHAINAGFSQAAGVDSPLTVLAREPMEPGVEAIIARAGRIPNSHVYAQLSDYYKARGNYRKALRFYRLATAVAATEDEGD